MWLGVGVFVDVSRSVCGGGGGAKVFVHIHTDIYTYNMNVWYLCMRHCLYIHESVCERCYRCINDNKSALADWRS